MNYSLNQNGESVDTPRGIIDEIPGHQVDTVCRNLTNRPDTSTITESPLYKPLLGPEIRLFSIQRARENSILRCNMFHVPLTEGLKFHALSYVWGDPEHKRMIKVNDKPLVVNQNLYDFLDQAWKTEDLFRHEYPATLGEEGTIAEALHWWIDAICINQGDIDEKNEQVPRMGQLYSSASQVWVWLGLPQTVIPDAPKFEMLRLALSGPFAKELSDADARGGKPAVLAAQPNTTAVNNGVRNIARVILERMQQDPRISGSPDLAGEKMLELQVITEAADAGVSEKGIRKGVDLPPTPDGEYTMRKPPGGTDAFLKLLLSQLDRLMANPWFDRTWIIQEFVLSQNRPIALIGNYSFHCTHLFQLNRNILQSRSTMSSATHSMLQGMISNMHKLSNLVNTHQWKRGPGGLFEVPGFPLLSPAHKLLHLLRMFSKKQSTVPHDQVYGMLGLLESQLPGHLKPDYRLPFERVCQDYARFILEDTGDLKIIEAHWSELEECPSWVPDLRYLDPPRKRHAASAMGAVRFSADGQKLTVEGVPMGRVSTCSCSRSHIADQSLIAYLRTINDIVLTGSAWLTQRPLEAVFTAWLEVLLVRQFVLPLSTVSGITSMESLISAFTACCLPITSSPEMLPRLTPSSFPKLFATNLRSPDLFHAVLSLASLGYCLLETGSIAICQLKTPEPQTQHHEGDAAWALKGCENLSILRPGEGGYAYVGHCLVLQPDLEGVPVASRFGMLRFGGSLSYVLDEEFFADKQPEEVVLV
jgi:hypothetical protein